MFKVYVTTTLFTQEICIPNMDTAPCEDQKLLARLKFVDTKLKQYAHYHSLRQLKKRRTISQIYQTSLAVNCSSATNLSLELVVTSTFNVNISTFNYSYCYLQIP